MLLATIILSTGFTPAQAADKSSTPEQRPTTNKASTATISPNKSATKPTSATRGGLQQVPVNSATTAFAQPIISELRLFDPNTGRRIYGQRRYQRDVLVEFIGGNGQPLNAEQADQYRYSYDRNFTGSQWRSIADYAMRRVPAPLPEQPGDHTVWVQVRKTQASANGNIFGQSSAPKSFTLTLTNATVQAEAELARRGCSYEAVYDNGTVINIRCPLADLVASLDGLNSIHIDLEKEGNSIESRLNLSGNVEHRDIAYSLKLGVIKPIEQVHIAANSVRTQSTTVSVVGNTMQLRFQFESADPEFILALKTPGKAPCDVCLPDLQWNNAAFTVNIPISGNNNSLNIGNASVSNLSGNWDLASGLAANYANELSNAGINGAQQLLNQARSEISKVVEQRVNEALTQQLSQLRDSVQAALRAGVGNSGDLVVGYQSYNSSIIASYRP